MAPDFIKSYWNILQGHGKQSAGVSQGLHTPLDCRLILINSCHCCFIRGQQRVHLFTDSRLFINKDSELPLGILGFFNFNPESQFLEHHTCAAILVSRTLQQSESLSTLL